MEEETDEKFDAYWTRRVDEAYKGLRKMAAVTANPRRYDPDWPRVLEDVAGLRWQLDRIERDARRALPDES